MPESLMVLVDVAGFTRPERKLAHQVAVRDGLYKVLEEAFTKARVDWSRCDREDRGDGAMILVPADVPAVVLADELLDRIVSALRDHNAVHAREASIQLRLVLHSGQVEKDAAGVAGPALNHAFRLLAAPVAKRSLRESGGLLAVVVSEHFYAEVISQRPAAAPDTYERIRAEFDGFAADAYLRLLGRPEGAPAAPEEPEVLGAFPREEMERVRGWLADVKELDFADIARRAAPSALPLPRFADPWHACTRLADVNSGPDGVPPVLVFLDALATEVGGELGGAMTGWVDRQVRRMRIEEAFAERRAAAARAVGVEQRLHLVISLEHDGIDADRYVLSAWRQDDPDVWSPVRGDIREVRVDDIERAVDDVVVTAERAWAGQRAAVTLEVFLPRELLGLPVHSWHKEYDSGQPQPLCLDYIIRVRSLDRLKATHWHRVWRERWQSMRADPSPARIHFAEKGEERVDVALRDHDSVAMVLNAPPLLSVSTTVDEFTAGLRSGLPVLLWCPGASSAELHELVTGLVERGGLFDLPHQSKKVRRAALRSSVYPFDSTHARDLVVLWDDPDRTIEVGRPAS
ncbi:VMAP-C domain-containing protein [Actinophytocola sp. KF-1]